MSVFYTFIIRIYSFLTWASSIVNTKARQRISGIKQTSRITYNSNNSEIDNILVHCASLGEYEQGRPIIDWVLNNTEYNIIISFFSPSGYNDCHLENERCSKTYLPFDIPTKMVGFIDRIDPKKVIIIKNEWWWNMLYVLDKKDIPTYLASSTIRNNHYFINYSNSFFINRLNVFNSIFTIDKESEENIRKVYQGDVFPFGDTRKDQVNKNAKNLKKEIDAKLIIYGSVWKEDIPILKEMINIFPNHKHIVYPHDLGLANINLISKGLSCDNVIEDMSQVKKDKVYINRSMGKLKFDYSYADIAYVGGGFGLGVHNILEASVYRIPVIIGPKHNKSSEAIELVKKSCIFVVKNSENVESIRRQISKDSVSSEIKQKLKTYFSTTESATDKICNVIFNTER